MGRSNSKKHVLKKHFKNIKFEILSPKNSPVPQYAGEEITSNGVKKVRKMISNWLNGLPVKKVRNFDPESFGGTNAAAVPASVSSGSIVTTTTARRRGSTREYQSHSLENASTNPSENAPTNSSSSSPTSDSQIANDDSTSSSQHNEEIVAGGELASKRVIFINSSIPENYIDEVDGLPVQRFVDNSIRTTKYNIFTFFPKNLFGQFKRIANFYFLVMVVLQCIPALNQVNAAFAAMPLIFVIGVTAIKDAIEDHKRYRSDCEFNNRKTRIGSQMQNENGHVSSKKLKLYNFFKKLFRFRIRRSRSSQRRQSASTTPIARFHNQQSTFSLNAPERTPSWKNACWKDVRVGDVIYLKENDSVPADIVILCSSEEESICYVETKDLDGESSLKIKRSPLNDDAIQEEFVENFSSYSLRVECENPSSNLFSFSGNLLLRSKLSSFGDTAIEDDAQQEVLHYPLNIENMILRGSSIKNTHHVVGIVVYTGVESKIMLNSGGGNKLKRSKIERQLNPMIIINLVILVILCIIVAIFRTATSGSAENTKAPYSFSTFSENQTQTNCFLSGFVAFWSSVLALQSLVPISLYVTVEFVRSFQAWFIHYDILMYNEELDKRCVPKAWNLSDDLGQIEYIFSDKTGTLTKNIMKLRQLSIGGAVYGKYELNAFSPAQSPNVAAVHQTQNSFEAEIEMLQAMSQIFSPIYKCNEHSLVDANLFKDISLDNEHSSSIVTFFQILSLCHSAVAKMHEDGETIEYLSQSPDEIALLETCRNLGFAYVKREKNTVFLSVLGEPVEYKILELLEFSSNRKRMSILVQDKQGRILLLCKGADSVIFERLANSEGELEVKTLEFLESFAEKGLRTLCVAFREISPEEYKKWHESYQQAASALQNRAEKIEEVAEQIEHSLLLLGTTAVEDELQDDVPEAIELLEKAGIKLWVLTGDKVETAINIGFSCNLLNRNMNLIVIKGTSCESISSQLEQAVKELWYENIAQDDDEDHHHNSSQHQYLERTFAFVIDGISLKHAISSERNRALFLCIACLCKSVICCRVSPLQKAKIVELVKHYKNATTLAIGDGANDVSMIKMANVGVGLHGKEGVQASMASDYAITEFRHLVRLLLVHGRWSYSRTSLTVLTSLFRNVLFTGGIFYFQFYSFYTSAPAYDFIFGIFYNLLYTMLISLALGIFEADLTADYCLRVPQLYRMGIHRKAFNIKRYALFMIVGVYMSLICFFFPLIIFHKGPNAYNGFTLGLDQFGCICIICIVFLAILFTGMQVSNWNVWIQVAVWGSMIIFFCFFTIYSFLSRTFMYDQFQIVFGCPLFYFTFGLVIIVALAPVILFKYSQNEFCLQDIDIVREIQKTKIEEENLFKSCLFPDDEVTAV